ncbi:MAG: hypothetical protein QQN57_07020, partial [Nitrosopumilus sp.]
MVNQPIWIAIVIGVFFVGIGVSYAHFANTYDPMSMKFHNQELFDQMMSHNPKMSIHWMDSGMMNQDMLEVHPEKMRTAAPLPETANGPQIDYSKGYLVEEIRDGLYWV